MLKKLILFTVLLFIVSVVYSQKNLPDISLKNLEGKSVSLAEISKNKTIVIDFWATWCVPCINELDVISEEYEDLQEEMGFELIAVSVDNSRSKSRVKPMVDGKGWEYQVLLDPKKELQLALNVPAVPYIMIVKNGKVVYTHQGYTPGAEGDLYDKFKALK